MLPRRLGARFALEALFLVLLAVGAGLADLRPLFIVLVMALAWLLVALAELTAERIDRSPLSYLLPARPEEEPERVFGPRPEERTVVAPLASLEAEAAAAEAESEPEPEPEPGPSPSLSLWPQQSRSHTRRRRRRPPWPRGRSSRPRAGGCARCSAAKGQRQTRPRSSSRVT